MKVMVYDFVTLVYKGSSTLPFLNIITHFNNKILFVLFIIQWIMCCISGVLSLLVDSWQPPIVSIYISLGFQDFTCTSEWHGRHPQESGGDSQIPRPTVLQGLYLPCPQAAQRHRTPMRPQATRPHQRTVQKLPSSNRVQQEHAPGLTGSVWPQNTWVS